MEQTKEDVKGRNFLCNFSDVGWCNGWCIDSVQMQGLGLGSDDHEIGVSRTAVLTVTKYAAKNTIKLSTKLIYLGNYLAYIHLRTGWA